MLESGHLPELAGAPPYSHAFQPIFDIGRGEIFSYEALIRGPRNESAGSVLSQVSGASAHLFDAVTRASAVHLAARLGIASHLNLNFLPRSLSRPAWAIESTLLAAERSGTPAARLVLEVTEGEMIDDHARFASIINDYRSSGIKLAIDDFGAGYSGLNLLAEFQPDLVKLDMSLARAVHAHGPRQAIVRAIVQVCADLGIEFIVEGVESRDEFAWFQDEGVQLFQGYLFARPAFEALPQIAPTFAGGA